VLELLVESEQVVHAGTALLTVGDPRDLEIVVELLSTDAVRIREGAAAWIEDWGEPTPLAAMVRRIEPRGFTEVSALGIEEQRVRVILELVADRAAWTRLGHGFRVFVRILVERIEDAPLLPLGALFRTGDAWTVYVADSGRARLREVEIGARDGRRAVVMAGLEVGERVILHPSDRITEGVPLVER
jgi:HlyD family secretion protein